MSFKSLYSMLKSYDYRLNWKVPLDSERLHRCYYYSSRLGSTIDVYFYLNFSNTCSDFFVEFNIHIKKDRQYDSEISHFLNSREIYMNSDNGNIIIINNDVLMVKDIDGRIILSIAMSNKLKDSVHKFLIYINDMSNLMDICQYE